MAIPSTWLEVGDRVFARRYAYLDQQIGLVLGRGEALVVDTRATPPLALELLDDIRTLTRDPVTVAVNTHWHWDHAFGNSVVRPAVIWGHERCRERLLIDGEAARSREAGDDPARRADFEAVVIDPPDRTLTIAADADVGGRRVELRYLGRGHTNGDIVVAVPDAGVLFAGDLLEEGAAPYFGDGYPMDWPATVERLLPLVVGPVVPGHGAAGDRSFVERQLEDLRLVAGLARRVHAGDLDRDAALAAMPFDAPTSVEPLDRALAQLRGALD
ncbi:MAG TPA: MBL fold metallo-hydrolase [Candidatus Sulfomarinibacteraceae bacterium]|nr:MBL fold metallo-hydrolase [Candidatus Sulfomarinibacteraceae bacterium]